MRERSERLATDLFIEIGKLKGRLRDLLDVAHVNGPQELGAAARDCDTEIQKFYELRKLDLVSLPYGLLDEFLDLVRLRNTYYEDSLRLLHRKELLTKTRKPIHYALEGVTNEVESLIEQISFLDPKTIDQSTLDKIESCIDNLDSVRGLAGLVSDLWKSWLGLQNEALYYNLKTSSETSSHTVSIV